MTRLNKIAGYLMGAIHDKCEKLTLKDFSYCDDFILAEDIFSHSPVVTMGGEFPQKWVNCQVHVLKRSKQDKYNEIYYRNLVIIINEIVDKKESE